MKKTIFLIGLILIVFIASGQSKKKASKSNTTSNPGITTTDYYDYKHTKIKEAVTEYPNGDLLSKFYYETGVLKQELLTNKDLVSSEKCISGKVYDKFGKLIRIESRNRKGELNGENKIMSYTPDYKSIYAKCYADFKDGKLIKYKKMYSFTQIYETFENHILRRFDEKGNQLIFIKYSVNDVSIEEALFKQIFDDGQSQKSHIYFKNGKILKSELVTSDKDDKFISNQKCIADSTNSDQLIIEAYDVNKKSIKILAKNLDFKDKMEQVEIMGVDQEKFFKFKIPSILMNDESNYNYYQRTYKTKYDEYLFTPENRLKILVQDGKEVNN